MEKAETTAGFRVYGLGCGVEGFKFLAVGFQG